MSNTELAEKIWNGVTVTVKTKERGNVFTIRRDVKAMEYGLHAYDCIENNKVSKANKGQILSRETVEEWAMHLEQIEDATRPLKATELKSISSIMFAANYIIEDAGPLEIKRGSQLRKHALENMMSTIQRHAYKLHIELPSLSRYYDPQQYIDIATLARDKAIELDKKQSIRIV